MVQALKEVVEIWREFQHTIEYLQRKPIQRLNSMDYDEYWKFRGHHSIQPRFEIFAQYIIPGSTVLDVGCGDGLFLKYLTEQKNVWGIGIDMSSQAVQFAQHRGVMAIVANMLECDMSYTFDYIILSEVLEHLASPEDLMYKLRLKYRKNILISIPNIGYYRHRLRLLRGNFPVQWAWHPAEHLRYWTVSDFVYWIKSIGFSIVAIKSSNGFPVLHRYRPNLFSNQTIFIVQ